MSQFDLDKGSQYWSACRNGGSEMNVLLFICDSCALCYLLRY